MLIKVLDLKKILETYDDNANVQISIHTFDSVLNYQDICVDEDYEKNDAIVLYVDDECLEKKCEDELD